MLKVDSYRLNQLINSGIVRDVRRLPKHPKYEEGKVYWCGYWQKYYKVIGVEYKKLGKYEYLHSVAVRWEDGRVGTHCTSLDAIRDYEIVLAA